MRTKIGRWGNSAAARIPKEMMDAAGFAPGAEVEVVARDGTIELRRPLRLKTVEELFAEYEAKYGPLEPPEAVDWGPDVGAEIIEEDAYSRGEITIDDLIPPDAPRRG